MACVVPKLNQRSKEGYFRATASQEADEDSPSLLRQSPIALEERDDSFSREASRVCGGHNPCPATVRYKMAAPDTCQDPVPVVLVCGTPGVCRW